MQFSVKGGNGEPPISVSRGGNGVPRTMGKCEGGNEGVKGAMPSRSAPVINPYAKQSRTGGVRKGGGKIGHGGASKGEKLSRHGGKSKDPGARLNNKKNGPRKMGRGSLMQEFIISVIVVDVDRGEGEESIDDVSDEAQTGEVDGDTKPIIKEGPYWRL